MGGGGDEVDKHAAGDGAFLAVEHERLRLVREGGFGDVDDGRDESEFFVEDGARHAAEELGQVALVVPLGDGAAVEDGVEVGLEPALDGGVAGEVDEGEVDAVGGGFVPGEDEDEGVAEDFLLREASGGGSDTFFQRWGFG